MMSYTNNCIMKDLPKGERPYEKCRNYGPAALSEAELLAVILRSGTAGKTSVQLAQEILMLCDNRRGIQEIYHLDYEDLIEISGIGYVKALQIQAIGELARRISRGLARDRLSFHNPATIAEYYMEHMRHREQECLICTMLDTKNHLICEKEIFVGTVNSSLVSPREIYIEAFRQKAVYIILVHNHPSGDPTPSEDDILVTGRIRECGELLGIKLLDHIIIGDRNYFSFRENKELS